MSSPWSPQPGRAEAAFRASQREGAASRTEWPPGQCCERLQVPRYTGPRPPPPRDRGAMKATPLSSPSLARQRGPGWGACRFICVCRLEACERKIPEEYYVSLPLLFLGFILPVFKEKRT